MTAGTNLRVSVWRWNYSPDDEVGGAMLTGTFAYENVNAFFQANRPEQVLLQQGLETNRNFQMLLYPDNLDIRERDEIEIIKPYNHVYIGKRFRVIGVQHSSLEKSNRNYILLNLSRIVESRTRQ